MDWMTEARRISANWDFSGETDDQSPERALRELAAALEAAYEKGRDDEHQVDDRD